MIRRDRFHSAAWAAFAGAAALALLDTSASAQKQGLESRLRPKSDVKPAGVYHVGTGTWTRPGAIEKELLGPQFRTIYNNTCSSPFFGAINPGETWTDEGALPGINKPNKKCDPDAGSVAAFVGSLNQCPEGGKSNPGEAQGSAARGGSYTIDAFTIGYCSDVPGPLSVPAGAGANILVDFRQSTTLDAVFCAESPLVAPAPQASFSLLSFPGAGAGPFSCWLVALDLTGVTASFTMLADANGDYDDPSDQNYVNPNGARKQKHCFSWSFSFPGIAAPTTTAASGMILAGNPNNTVNGWITAMTTGGGSTPPCCAYDGTVWDIWEGNTPPRYGTSGNTPRAVIDNANVARGALVTVAFDPGSEPGTGMNTQDSVRVDLSPATSVNGCYFFGGPSVGNTNPFSSFHLELYTLAPSVDNVSAQRNYGPYGSRTMLLTSPSPGSGFCYGDGCAFTCPCVAPNVVPDAQGGHESGCANSNPLGLANVHGARLEVQGLSNRSPLLVPPGPGPDTIQFVAVTGTAGFAFLVKGNAKSMNGVFPATSDGVRCAAGALVRFGGHNVGSNGANAGFWTYPNTAQTTPVSVATAQPVGMAWYQLFYRNPAANFCNTFTTNFSNGQTLVW